MRLITVTTIRVIVYNCAIDIVAPLHVDFPLIFSIFDEDAKLYHALEIL